MSTIVWILIGSGVTFFGLAMLIGAAIEWNKAQAEQARLDELHELELEEIRQRMRLREQGNPFA